MSKKCFISVVSNTLKNTVVDGSGVKVQDDDNYPNGKIEISQNEIVRNGVAGVEIENFDGVVVSDNVIVWNGMTSKDVPEDRPDSIGIVISNGSTGTELSDNQIYVYFSDDVGLEADSPDAVVDSGSSNDNNVLCGGSIAGQAVSDFTSIGSASCADSMADELQAFLDNHNVVKTTMGPTTTVETTGPNLPYMSDTILDNPIATDKVLYVDAIKGASNNHGQTLSRAKPTIPEAIDIAEDGTTIYVLNGDYYNENYNTPGLNNNPTAVTISQKNNIILRNYPGHNPVIKYDGNAGVTLDEVHNVEIRGFNIQGPCDGAPMIDVNDALSNRLNPTPKYNGVGIDILPDSHHVRITHNKIFDASSSGIRSTGNDYLSIINNEISSNTGCSSDGGAGVLIQDPKSIDSPVNPETTVKIGVINNEIKENINNVPFYHPQYNEAMFVINNGITIPRENYGTTANPTNSGFILDGAGIKIITSKQSEDNDDFPENSGKIEVSNNLVVRNGVEGILVSDTDDVVIKNNDLAWNGMTSKDAPESRFDSVGIRIEESQDIEVSGNEVVTYFRGGILCREYFYMISSPDRRKTKKFRKSLSIFVS